LRRHKLPLEVACMALASPLWSEIERMPPQQHETAQALRMVYGPAMLNGPFAIVLGFNGGMVALNDRIKLRPLVAARDGDVVYVASEESAIREICPHPAESWMPMAGEPVIARVSEKGRQKSLAQTKQSVGQRRVAQGAGLGGY
jgi:glutamate synthase domain-containing protein 1